MRSLSTRLPWLLLIALGAGAFLLAEHYGFGTLRRMRAGMVPGILSGLLVLVGLAALLESAADRPRAAIRPMLFVVAAMGAFAGAVTWFGLVPATFAAVVIAYLGQRDRQPLPALVLGASVALGVWLIFPVMLALPVPAFRWPA